MKNALESNEKQAPVVKVDKSLNKYSNVVLFPEKVEKAKKTIARIGVPQKISSAANKSVGASGADIAHH